MGIHPAVSLIAVFAGAKLYGILGALFAAPIASILQTGTAAVWKSFTLKSSQKKKK